MELPVQLPVPQDQALAWALALGGLVVLLALLLTLLSLRRTGRMLRHYRTLTEGAEGRDLAALLEGAVSRLRAVERRLEALEVATEDLEDLRRRLREDRSAIQALQTDTADLGNQARRLSGAEGGLQQLSGRSSQLASRLQLALKHVGLVRYKAFEDVGGDQSFALALLDDDQSGVVLAGLHGRSGDRIYAKPVQQGRSSYALSQEEMEAIARAGRGTRGSPEEVR